MKIGDTFEIDGTTFKVIPFNGKGDPCEGCAGNKQTSSGCLWCGFLPSDCCHTENEQYFIYDFFI